jgi:hypothetical protein
MTGANVAFRMRRDSFVPEKIDHQLTASPSAFAAAITRTVFASGLYAWSRLKQ